MKRNVTFDYRESRGYVIRRYQVNGKSYFEDCSVAKMIFRYPIEMKLFEHTFLSWENLSYVDEYSDEEGLDDYLLNHALQDNLKTSISVITKKADEVCSVFGDDYSILKTNEKYGFERVTVVRNGKLSDYFDVEKLSEYYDYIGIDYNDGVFDRLIKTEMCDLFSSKIYSHKEYLDVTYSPIMSMEGDDYIIDGFGTAGVLIAGLLFGYPIESTYSIINETPIFF